MGLGGLRKPGGHVRWVAGGPRAGKKARGWEPLREKLRQPGRARGVPLGFCRPLPTPHLSPTLQPARLRLAGERLGTVLPSPRSGGPPSPVGSLPGVPRWGLLRRGPPALRITPPRG